MTLGWWLLGAALAVPLYAYLGYPALLAVVGRVPRRRAAAEAGEWPRLSVTIPCYNEERRLARAIEGLLAADYPPDRLQIVVLSDGSTDGTDAIARSYRDRGVELVRLEERRGKTAAENASARHVRGEIIVNTDASVRIHPAALKRLASAFADPSVGVASGRDLSVSEAAVDENRVESGYVGYEMWVRDLETRGGSIVGASGCLFATRAELHRVQVPEALSRDFASALIAREQGYRSVSVRDALCFVPRTSSLRREYRRKVRTMTRGVQTLFHRRHLLNPFRFGAFAWMLFSHKVCRWLVPWAGLLVLVGVGILATSHPWARWILALFAACGALAVVGWRWPEGRSMPRLVSLPTFVIAANLAALHASIAAVGGRTNAMWEPTRREVGEAG